MSSLGSGWQFDRDRLREAMGRWRTHEPSVQEQTLLEGFLMDLVADPFSKGKEDGDSGVWTGWAGPFILVTYVPERGTRRIHVADISYG